MARDMKQIGLVGLGNAGRPLGERLLHKGFPLKVYDLNPDTAEPLVKLGAEIAGSAEEATCDVTITVLPSSVEVRAAVLGQGGVLGGIRPGFTLIDLSGTDPDCARELQQQIREKNGEFLGGTLHASGAPSVTIPSRIRFESFLTFYRVCKPDRGKKRSPRVEANHSWGRLRKFLRESDKKTSS